MAGPWSLHLVAIVDKVIHLGSAKCFRQKECRAKKLGHGQSEKKSSFGVEILGTRPPP